MLRSLYTSLLCLSLLLAASGCTESNQTQDSPSPPDDSPTTPVQTATTPADSPGNRRFIKNGLEYEEYTVDKRDYRDPPLQLSLKNDELVLDEVPEFNPELVHPDPLEGWDVNLSHAVLHLDTPVLKPDYNASLLMLRPSYKAAVESHSQILPSVNLIDGKAKQFDDGLYAALDLAYYAGHEEVLRSHVELIRQIAEKLGPDNVATPFLAAGLELAGVEIPVTDQEAKVQFLEAFERDPLRSKPLGFYNWSPQLAECYRFLKYFQSPLKIEQGKFPETARALADVIQEDPHLRQDYERALGFYSQLTNPLIALSLLDVSDQADAGALAESQMKAHMHPWVSVFPASTSKEQRLFDRLFPLGFPEGANLMQELIRAVQKGEVDLAPGPESGWYDYQAYALETFLLPDRSEESRKLLLTARYKQRMLDAFAALITKRRETHIRQLAAGGVTGAEPPYPNPLMKLSPRLRLEPNATYYLRTARAYLFLQTFLNESVGESVLKAITGMREKGLRETNLSAELESQKNLFYGFYLLSLEDVGLPPSLVEGELLERESARQLALNWLKEFKTDPDLAADTRVVVPVAVNPIRGTTQLWGTAGVRLAKLDVNFDKRCAPSIRPTGIDEEWKRYEGEMETTTYYIPVDEFISFEINRLDCPTREEFRKLCDEAQSKEKLIELLQAW